MASENRILLVEALYSFKGKNNDELCFSKGDVITVTQREEGGWWEGTLNDNTGWFPSNYAKEYKAQDGLLSPQRSDVDLSGSQQLAYRKLVLKDVLESERSHVADLQSLLGGHLAALRKAEILSDGEYRQLTGNLEDVTLTHCHLISCLEEQGERPPRDQRFGGAFLTMAPQLQAVHKAYCSNHPKAVCVLEKYKEDLNSFMECHGAPRPGLMTLTSCLSRPFRRLDKYPGMLQEYERHLEGGHSDRGDTQRSSHVYKELASTCAALRRQKELELEVVTGVVHGWDGGESLGSLGEVNKMGSVALLPDHRDHYLVLFPAVLVILAVSPRMSAFIFEGSYPLISIHVNKLEDTDHYKNAFEISGPLSERIVAVCQSRQEQHEWVDGLARPSRPARTSGHAPKPPAASPPLPPAHSTSLSCSLGSRQTSTESPLRARRAAGGKVWNMSCLRPSPPLRPGLTSRDEKRGHRHTKRKDEKWHEDDTLILRVIEAYCTSAKTRYTINSIDLGGCRPPSCVECHAEPSLSLSLSPFGDLQRGHLQRSSNWCCGIAIKTIKKNIDFDC